MAKAHPMSSLILIFIFFAAVSSYATIAATTHMLETTIKEDACYWNRAGIQELNNYSCYLFVSELMSFRQANESCVDEGGHLVSIGSQSENALVSGLTQTDVWIGLYRLTNETCAGRSCTTWMWLDGSGLEYDTWTALISPTTTQCVFLTTDGTWEHGRPCFRNQSFVCEKSIPPSTTPERTTIAVTSEITYTRLLNSGQLHSLKGEIRHFNDKRKNGDEQGFKFFKVDPLMNHCPSDIIVLRGIVILYRTDACIWNRNDTKRDQTDQSCYLFVSERMTFHQANQCCVDEGAHLVSIGNQSENALVSGLIQTDVWIGLYRLTNESCAGRSCKTWMWLDGSGLDYDTWTDLISPTTTQCVFLTTAGTWEHGRDCSKNQSFVCEMSIPPSTTPEPTTSAITSEMTNTSLLNSETDHFSIFLGVGVFVGIFVIAFIVGAACLMKRRHGRKVKTCKVTADKDVSTDIGNYENIDMSVSSHGLAMSQHATPEDVYENSVTIDTTISTRNHEDDTSNRPAYEEVTHYTAVSPEYTPLQFTNSSHTNINR